MKAKALEQFRSGLSLTGKAPNIIRIYYYPLKP